MKGLMFRLNISIFRAWAKSVSPTPDHYERVAVETVQHDVGLPVQDRDHGKRQPKIGSPTLTPQHYQRIASSDKYLFLTSTQHAE